MTQAQTITLYQPLLHQVAYRLLKCKADAEDIVQDTFVRWLSIDTKAIENKKAYLIKMVTNNCLSHLESLKKKKQAYLESIQLPEFVQQLKMDFSHLDVGTELKGAMAQLQSKLQPLERAVFILKESLGFDYDELQELFQKKKDHLRQLLSRAKKKLEDKTPSVEPAPAGMLDSFSRACLLGEAAELIAELKKQAQ
ncbi:MAG: sigma-70 family RNA polymerase sigma factor [Cyclobacteriaceae bacterium]